MNVPEKQYTQKDVEKARIKGKVVGWVQGAVVGIGGVLLMSVAGWIPIVLGVGLAGYIGTKLISRRSSKSAE